jgi:hypothetical protein
VICKKQIFRVLPLLGLLGLAAPVALAQSPRYTPPPPPTKGVALEMRLRYLVPPDINFSGLGTIGLRDNYDTTNNLLLGTTRELRFDDGYISQDYIESTLVAGDEEGAQRVPSPNTDATSNFGYQSADQVDPNDPSMLIFHRYASTNDPDLEYAGSSSGAMGWELNYTKYINRKRNLGVQVGFAFNGFDSRFNESIDADLYVQEFRHQMADGALVPDLPDPTLDDDGNVIEQPPYQGDVVREEVNSGDLLEWLASEESEEILEDGATVDATADLRSSVYSFRAGPTYSVNIWNDALGFQVGAGLSAIYYSGRFSAYEILQNPGGGENPSRGLTTTEEADWQVGGYVDASACYSFNQRVSLFSGMQVQSGSTYTQANEDRQADVDFSSQVYVHAGVGIRF